jgi:hypothetical protein
MFTFPRFLLQLVENGCLWHLLLLLFGYDYTLHDSGVEANVETNEQEGLNNSARVILSLFYFSLSFSLKPTSTTSLAEKKELMVYSLLVYLFTVLF